MTHIRRNLIDLYVMTGYFIDETKETDQRCHRTYDIRNSSILSISFLECI